MIKDKVPLWESLHFILMRQIIKYFYLQNNVAACPSTDGKHRYKQPLLRAEKCVIAYPFI
jgi:hypothetical protein